MEIRWQVEHDPYCVAVLEKHWPKVKRYGDIRQVDPSELEPVDLLCGGFPCQPVSLAGRRLGQADPRWLWPEFARFIRVLRPRYVLVENVPGLLVGGGMAEVLGDLAACGYDAEWDCIPAAAVGAPHLRYRVFLVAYPSERRSAEQSDVSGQPQSDIVGRGADVADADDQRELQREGIILDKQRRTRDSGSEVTIAHRNGERRTDAQGRTRQEESKAQRSIFSTDHAQFRVHDWEPEPDVGRVAHGVPARVDRLRALGNAVVPQVAEWVGKRIMAAVR